MTSSTSPAAERSLTTRTHGEHEVRTLTLARTYDADLAEVWSALTTGERISRWLTPVTGDLQQGGRYQLEGNAAGEITDCVETERYALTWEYDGSTSWVEVTLRPTDVGTLVQLDHSARLDEDPAFEERYGPGAVGVGWELGALGLAQHLEAPEAEAPAAADMAALAGLMRESADGWAEAAIAWGTDEAQARAAADRCFASYTGTEEA